MLARVFDKSKPINFLIVFFIMLLVFLGLNIKTYTGSLSASFVIKQFLAFLVSLANLAVLNFLVNKNSLTQNNSYKILLFSLFLAMIPIAMITINILLSNLFILLAIRRIISLKSLIRVKKKLLDASILICIASLFYFWSILFMLLVFSGLIFYSENKIKNWIIPFIGVMAMSVLVMSFNIIYSGNYGDISNYIKPPNFSFKSYKDSQLAMSSIVLILFGLWSSFFYVKRINKKLKSFRPSYIIVLLYTIIAIATVVFSHKKNGSELLFLFAPLSIIITNYIETISDRWFKETLLIVLILIPISFQFF